MVTKQSLCVFLEKKKINVQKVNFCIIAVFVFLDEILVILVLCVVNLIVGWDELYLMML